jgi:hypothetical protein
VPFSNDRGRIVRITFDIVYPTGQLKTVGMNLSDSDWGDTALIAISEQGIRDILAPGLAAHSGDEAGMRAIELFATPEEGAVFKPAMLVVLNGGDVIQLCGGHHGTSHPEAGNAIGRFM